MRDAATQEHSWLAEANRLADAFAKKHGHMLSVSERQLSAAFEIGSLHALLRYYESQRYVLEPANLTTTGEYRYLTSPNGSPANFSYVRARGPDGIFEIRQQVRVESHVDERICFTPDIVVMVEGADIKSSKDNNYASGKRPFFRVSSSEIVAAHECKSMNPFPELIVSFIGMLVVAHEWYPNGNAVELTKGRGHLAPTLFVGGSARGLHLRMITAMQESYAMNIVCGLHEGTWGLSDAENRLLWRRAQASAEIGLEEEDLPF
jgi:hypothetical protein